MHAKVRRESVAGYATDETWVCGPKEHTRWWQRYRGHMQGLLYRLILNSYLSRCSKLIAIKLCAISEMHAKVRRESVAGYATDETLVCGPKEHTRWWQRYGRHLQCLLYRLILNSYLSSFVLCWQKHQPLPNRQPTASLRHSRGKGSRQRRLLTSMTLSSITASPHS